MQQFLEQNTNEVSGKTKKETIIAMFKAGVDEIEMIASVAGAKPSYVASVLQAEGLIDRYFDLYTSTNMPMNIYSKHFQGRLGFKDIETAERGVRVLDAAYRHFEYQQDRAGQHHTLEMALVMLDRARWTGKLAEAEIYRQWLMKRLSTPLIESPKPEALSGNEQQVQTEEPQLKLAA
ncbi:MAG: hypothetical protein ACJ72Z_12740 [Pyrinomonadaceae bacterium]